MKQSPKHNNNGFTIIELLIAIAILGVGTGLAFTQISSLKKSVARLELKRQIADLRESIMATTNCHQTLRPFIKLDGSIDCSGSINLKDSSGRNFTQSPINNFQISATCSGATGLTIQVKSAVGAKDPLTGAVLDHSNSILNPFLGRGTAYGLCENFFRNTRRVRVFHAQSSDLPIAAAECSKMLSQNTESPPHVLSQPVYEQMIRTNSTGYLLVNTMDKRCANYCAGNPRYYVGGYIADCNSSGATCVCFR